AGATWNEIDLDAAEWMLPAARTKNGREHRMPLTEPALSVLREAATLSAEGWVLPAARGKGHVTIYGMLDAMQRILGPDVTVHDFRRTVATGLQRLGIRLEVTEAVLNHVSGSRAGVVGIYQRHDWAAEKRTALEAWARHVLALAGGAAEATNIVTLPAAGLHAA
ncbi:MAG: site-specific integrase, partial [Acetobacteraceae bacterium]